MIFSPLSKRKLLFSGPKWGKGMQNPVYRVCYMSNLQCAEQRIPSKASQAKHSEQAPRPKYPEQAFRAGNEISLFLAFFIHN